MTEVENPIAPAIESPGTIRPFPNFMLHKLSLMI